MNIFSQKTTQAWRRWAVGVSFAVRRYAIRHRSRTTWRLFCWIYETALPPGLPVCTTFRQSPITGFLICRDCDHDYEEHEPHGTIERHIHSECRCALCCGKHQEYMSKFDGPAR